MRERTDMLIACICPWKDEIKSVAMRYGGDRGGVGIIIIKTIRLIMRGNQRRKKIGIETINGDGEKIKIK